MAKTEREAIEDALETERSFAKRQVLLKQLWKLNQPATWTQDLPQPADKKEIKPSAPRPKRLSSGAATTPQPADGIGA